MINKKEVTKSPQTTLYGILVGISGLITAFLPLLDGNPETMISMEIITASVTQLAIGLGLIKARDHGVSSEQAKE